jgi:hypothetical protein
MLRKSGLLLFIPVFALLLQAADPEWMTKAPARWSEEDAQAVLAKSPWVKLFSGVLAPPKQESQGSGAGYDHVDPKGSGYKPPIFPGKPGTPPRTLPGAFPLEVRWESATAIRLAEAKLGQDQLAVDGDGYQIAVFGIPTPDKIKDPDKAGEPLKAAAALKREGKKDVKPVKVEVFQREEGLVIIYVFPLSAELAKEDGRVEFHAVIGRITASQSFDLTQMDFQGKLAL